MWLMSKLEYSDFNNVLIILLKSSLSERLSEFFLY
jgi:hypothetical protein